MRGLALAGLLACAGSGAAAQGAPTRLWRSEERALITDLSRVTAVAATQAVVYAATPNGIAVYDRGFARWRETISAMDGFPGGPVTAMVADPADDTAWLGGQGLWARYQPLGRRWDLGPLPGPVDYVALDSREPSRGAYFHTAAGWYFVARMSFVAEPARDVPPPASRIGPMSANELMRRAPALDVVRARLERDEQLRATPITSAALAPVSNDAFIGTYGNGVFRVDVATYGAERLPAGILTQAAGGIGVGQGRICVGHDVRFVAGRRGITCFRDDGSDFTYYEGEGLRGLPGSVVHRLLVTQRALWAATDQGAVRVDRGSDRARQLLGREGLPSPDVRALAYAVGGVWIGTTSGLTLARDGEESERSAPVSVATGPVLSLATHGDTLWIGTAQGLDVLLPGAADPVTVRGGPLVLREPIVALATRGETLLVATETRLVWRADTTWRVVTPPGEPIGRVTAVAADRDGFWVAGTAGFAFFQPATNYWRGLNSTGDVPLPISDIAASRDHVWVATPLGVVRFERRVLTP